MQRWIRWIVPLCLLTCLIAPRIGYAQGGAASLRGTVTDPSGRVIPAAQVTATQVGTRTTRTVTTDGAGDYFIPELAPGDYVLTVKAQGFSPLEQKGITLQADQSATDNMSLAVGTAAQTGSVEGTAPMVDTTTGTLNQVVHLWKYESMADRERRRAGLESDPDWISFRKKSAEGQYLVHQENRILKSTKFSPL